MLLYKDGELKDEYTGKRTASSIIDYLSGKMRPDIRDELWNYSVHFSNCK